MSSSPSGSEGFTTTASLAAVFRGVPDTITLESLPRPRPREGQAVVRVLGCTLCGSDLHSIDGRRKVPVPTILGHEIVGVIEELGPGKPATDVSGQPLKPGTRVTWAIVASCGDCFYCRRSLPQKCLRAVKYGHEAFRPGEELFGGLAEHCLLAQGTAIVLLPDDLPRNVACPASCATATVAAAWESSGSLKDRNVMVFGSGMLGLTACAMAAARGASHVVCVEPNPLRREIASRFGATRVVAPDQLSTLADELTNGFGFDIILEVSGQPTAFEAALPLMRMGGILTLVGAVFPGPPIPLLQEQIVRRQLRLQGIHNYAPRHLEQAVEFLSKLHLRYPFAELVKSWYPLREIREALNAAHDPGVIRIGVGVEESSH